MVFIDLISHKQYGTEGVEISGVSLMPMTPDRLETAKYTGEVTDVYHALEVCTARLFAGAARVFSLHPE
jgi:hypothetical protein